MSFINESFLLKSDAARRLYFDYAEPQPILDYHNHLPPRDLAENRQFNDLFEIWLEGDHYKWRALRANRVDERFITADASPYEKFVAWAKNLTDEAWTSYVTLGTVPAYNMQAPRTFGVRVNYAY